MTNPLMQGKRGLIMGVANERSLAWGISQQLFAQGAELAFSYPNDALLKRVKPLAKSVNSSMLFPCDVSKEEDIAQLFTDIKQHWSGLDFILHAIAFSDKNELTGEYINTSKQNFLNTLDISCYSLTATARYGLPLMNDGGSLLTLTYFGSEKVMPHYNVMGVAKAALEASVRYLAVDLGQRNVRINALSAGPAKTLAASGIGDFKYIFQWTENNAPLRRNVLQEEIGKSGLYLLSDLSSGVTGELHHVDCGYNTIGMKNIHAKDISL